MRIILARIFSLGLIVAFAFFVCGCESTPQTNARVLLKTSRTSYHIDDTVRIEVTNLSGSPIYYICNGQIRLQLIEAEQVRATWEIRPVDTCLDKRTLLLGDVVTFAVLPRELDSAAADTRFVTGGEYRFLIDLYKDSESTILLEEESDRLTNNVVLTR